MGNLSKELRQEVAGETRDEAGDASDDGCGPDKVEVVRLGCRCDKVEVVRLGCASPDADEAPDPHRFRDESGGTDMGMLAMWELGLGGHDDIRKSSGTQRS